MYGTTRPLTVGALARLALALIVVAAVVWFWVARPKPLEADAEQVQLTGRVLGPDGQPVPGAEVGVMSHSTEMRRLDDVFTTACGQAGEFALVTQDQSWLGRQWPAYWLFARAQGGALMGASIVTNGSAGTPIEIRLDGPGYIRTWVRDPDGFPLAGVQTHIWACKAGISLAEGPQTDEQGEADIGPLPAGPLVNVSVPQELRHLVAENVWDGEEITLEPGQTYELPPLTLDPDGRSIEGTLEDADGNPLPGARVASNLPVSPPNVATADERGRFKLTRLPVQGFDVWLIAGDAAKQLYAMAPVDPDLREDVQLVLRPLATARGLLRHYGGQALAGVEVCVVPMVEERSPAMTWHERWSTEWIHLPPPKPAKTAEDGSWQVSGLVAGGVYSLQPKTGYRDQMFDAKLFEVDPEGKPTDLGPMKVAP